MKQVISIIFLFLTLQVSAQDSLSKKISETISLGTKLYRLEKSNWYAVSVYAASPENRNNVGGYFSYMQKDSTMCVFFSRDQDPHIIATVSFDSTYNTETAKLIAKNRAFTTFENQLFEMRNEAFVRVYGDTSFVKYPKTNLNLIPLIENDKKKVYVLCEPKQNGVVIFGNDFILDLNADNKIEKTTALHKEFNQVPFANEDPGSDSTHHIHIPGEGQLLTATDICTLLLYETLAHWKKHTLVTGEYVSTWDCTNHTLQVVPVKN